jgi:hypothetical protein
MAADFYFPRTNYIWTVSLAQCIDVFSYPQKVNIMSWIRHLMLTKRTYKLKDLKIPRYL